MHISRRNFLHGMTASAGTLWSSGVTGFDNLAGRELDCVVLDLKLQCVLRESLHGYQTAFADEHHYLAADRLDSRWRCRMVIVPGLGMMDPAIGRTLLDSARRGACLVLESGAGFLSPAETAAHQRMLLRCFELEVKPPVDLWSGKLADDGPFASGTSSRRRETIDGRQAIPYVRYVWPREIMVRDFTRVIPVSAKRGEVIGWAGSLAVGSRRPVGKGTLVFLGSPLGPALRTGDPEARSWLQSVVAL
jgi:hypothetical protein